MSRSAAVGLNEIKADFSNVYDLDDPRAYFRSLTPNDYIIPHLAQNVFLQLIDARRQSNGAPVNIIDLGCSYGINAALMKRALTWDMLAQRYVSAEMTHIDSAEVRRLDALFLASWPLRPGVSVTGVDVAERAVRYAEETGALDLGFAIDLETQPASKALAAAVRQADLIVSTGCVGYVTERTFAKLADVISTSERKPWIASFVLRLVDFSPIANVLKRAGLHTEQLDGVTFVQRRFADLKEMEETVEALKGRGIDPSFHEARGMLHADFYLSRPAEAIARQPLLNKPFLAAAEAMSGNLIDAEGTPGVGV